MVEFGGDVELGARDAGGDDPGAKGLFVGVDLGGWRDVSRVRWDGY